MLGKVKLFFGIEGLKVDLHIPESFSVQENQVLEGSLRLHSKTEQKIKKIQILLIETYERGRGKDKRTNDYTWGKIELHDTVLIEALSEKIIDFRLPIKPKHSKIEEFGNKNIVLKKVSSMAKWINGAKSEYTVEVNIDVQGVGLKPSVKKKINLI